MILKNSKRKIVLTGIAAIILVAGVSSCKTADDIGQNMHDFGQKDDSNASVDAALERAANQVAIASGQENMGSLRLIERSYTKDSKNPQTAKAYAKALRQNGYANRASVVLAPFAKDPTTSKDIQLEYAFIQMSLGRYVEAEKFAVKSIRQSPSDNWAGYHVLGLALEAQGQHIKAERAFRKALELCDGDRVPIMNNLALNLAAQGRLDESLDLLTRAQAQAPNRPDIKSNIKIVQTLIETKK